SANSSNVVTSNGCQFSDVDVTGGRDDPKKIFTTPKADKAARFRIFFVGQLGSGDKRVAQTVIGGKDCLCQDDLEMKQGPFGPVTTSVVKIAHVLAHEAGHALGEVDNTSDKKLLMFETTAGGERLPLDAAVRMNNGLK